jgi:amidohydrolase
LKSGELSLTFKGSDILAHRVPPVERLLMPLHRIIPGMFALALMFPHVSSGGDAKDSPAPPPDSWVKERLAAVDESFQKESQNLLALYEHIHSNPELSLFEEKTAARLASELRKLGFEVTEKVGGHGIVGVFKNGPGPTVLVRTDMDGLPVIEQTGLAFASRLRANDREGKDVGVMHACGHDIHMATWVGTARALVANKDKWSGTLLFIGQPAEEIGAGARMMLADGLYTKFPKPDFALALHTDALSPYGTISYGEGLLLANADSVDITVKGRGGHGSAPHLTIDPVVLACKIVMDLQLVVSRERDPQDPVVITVGSIHGGTKHNIIPNEVKLQLTVRTTKDTTRDQTLKAITRVAQAAAAGMRAPEPEVKPNIDFTPATVNDGPLARRTAAVFRSILGTENVRERRPVLGAEDFSHFARGGVPIFLYFLGTIPPEKYEASLKEGATPLPGWHSDRYAPSPEPSIKTGVRTMSLAVMNLMPKK